MVLPDQVFGKPPNPLIFFHNWFINILIWGEWYTAFFQTHTHIIIIFVGYLFSNLYPINMPLVSFAQIPQISCYVYIYVYNVYIYTVGELYPIWSQSITLYPHGVRHPPLFWRVKSAIGLRWPWVNSKRPWARRNCALGDEFHVHLGMTVAKLAFVNPTYSNLARVTMWYWSINCWLSWVVTAIARVTMGDYEKL